MNQRWASDPENSARCGVGLAEKLNDSGVDYVYKNVTFSYSDCG